LDGQFGWIDVGAIDTRELEETSDLSHHILDRRHGILQKVPLVRRID
jgi:hypothetical protein